MCVKSDFQEKRKFHVSPSFSRAFPAIFTRLILRKHMTQFSSLVASFNFFFSVTDTISAQDTKRRNLRKYRCEFIYNPFFKIYFFLPTLSSATKQASDLRDRFRRPCISVTGGQSSSVVGGWHRCGRGLKRDKEYIPRDRKTCSHCQRAPLSPEVAK